MANREQASTYRVAMLSALVQQLVVLPLSVAMDHDLDVTQICLGAFLAFWVGAALIRLRRPQNPTRGDVIAIRSGYIPLCVFAGLITKWAWTLRGF